MYAHRISQKQNHSSFRKDECEISVQRIAGYIEIKMPYHPALIACIKHLPSIDRRYDASRKVWQVSAAYSERISEWIKKYFTQDISLNPEKIEEIQETRIINCHYIGSSRARGGDEREAYGMDEFGNWTFIFPESVLRSWFFLEKNPALQPTLYGVLGIRRDAGNEEIITGYRRLALQWHPDRCHEPDAHEVFLKIQSAYDVLIDKVKRTRYDAGLLLQSHVSGEIASENRNDPTSQGGFRSPIRCGLLLVDGHDRLGRFCIDEILSWQDIHNNSGQTLVVSWQYGNDAPTKVWA